jgi:hypothetical protein
MGNRQRIPLSWTPARSKLILTSALIPSWEHTNSRCKRSAGTSNAVPFTVYAPQPGPLAMNAIPGYLVDNNETDAPFVVVADINGDGFADVHARSADK